MFLNLFDIAIKSPFNKKERVDHDSKPESSFFEEQENNLVYYSERIAKDNKVAPVQIERLLTALIKAINKSDYPNQLKVSVLDFVFKLGVDHRLFPDIDTADIWYTDYFDLIQCAEKLGIGDPRLPHWPEESNIHHRYLELSKNELVGMFVCIMNTIVDKEEANLSLLSVDWNKEIKDFTNKSVKSKK